MREIETRIGKILVGDDEKYYIQRMYDDLYMLIQDEDDLLVTIKEWGFKINKSDWRYKVHPLSDDVLFTLNLEVEYIE